MVCHENNITGTSRKTSTRVYVFGVARLPKLYTVQIFSSILITLDPCKLGVQKQQPLGM